MPTPLLILSDSPASTSGLGRITRDLALRIHEHMSDVFKVGCLGCGGNPASPALPFPVYEIHDMKEWVVTELPDFWKAFAGDQHGILLVIWDASRLLWLSHPDSYCHDVKLWKFLMSKPFDLWTYSAIDAEGPNGKLSVLLKHVLTGFDRVLAYSEWSARILERTFDDGRTVEALPHGIDTAVFRPRGRDKARRKFGELVCGGEADELRIEDGKFLVGIVATNQARKDYGTAFAALAELAKIKDVMAWIRVDTLERFWSISALTYDYSLHNRLIISLGALTDEQMTWAYSACDVTWGIGLGEGWGMPLAESIACGSPCIHGNYAGGAEFVPKQFLIEPRAFRFEGSFACVRPVYEASQWVKATIENCREQVSVPTYIRWDVCWPRWEEWLRKGTA